MKCNQCGSNLSVDEERCPYCGAENHHYQSQREQMKSFQSEYREAQREVLEESRKYAGSSVRITILVVLAVIDVMMLFFAGDGFYDVANKSAHTQAVSGAVEHGEVLKQLEEEQDYLSISMYVFNLNIYEYNELEEYEIVNKICSDYAFLYKYIMQLGSEDDRITDEMRIEYIGDYLDRIYDTMERKDYILEECYEGIHGETIENMKYNIQLLLMTYANVPKEVAEQFPELSKGRRMVEIEKGLESDGN